MAGRVWRGIIEHHLMPEHFSLPLLGMIFANASTANSPYFTV
jgi:hypothetical protein